MEKKISILKETEHIYIQGVCIYIYTHTFRERDRAKEKSDAE